MDSTISANTSVLTKNLIVRLSHDSGTPYKVKLSPQNRDEVSGYLKINDQKVPIQKVTYDSALKSLDSTKFMQLFTSTIAPLEVIVDQASKSVHIREDKTRSIAPKSTVFVKGICSRGKYKIQIDFENRENVVFALLKKTEKGSSYEPVTVNFPETMKTCSDEELINAISIGDDLTIKMNERGNISFDITSKSLTADKKWQRIIEQLIRGISAFTISSQDTTNGLDATRQTIEKLLEIYNKLPEVNPEKIHIKQPLKDPEILKALAKILNNYLKVEYDHILTNIPKIDKPKLQEFFHKTPLSSLNTTNLVSIVKILLNELKQLNEKQVEEKQRNFQIAYNLEIIISLVNLLAARGVDNEIKGQYEEFYNAVTSFKESEDLIVRYLAKYGEQTLRLIPDVENESQVVFRSAYHFLKGAVHGCGFIDIKTSWKEVERIFQSIPELKNAFNIYQETEQKRFIKIFFIKEIVANSAGDITKLIKYLDAGSVEGLIDADDLQDHNFMMGLTNILWEYVQLQKIDDEETVEIATSAITLLQKIWLDNHNNVSSAKYTLKETKYCSNLGYHISEMLDACTVHTNKKLKKAAKAAVNEIKRLVINFEPSFTKSIETNMATRLLTEAVQSKDVLFNAIKANLDDDEQVAVEQEYYIELDGKESELDQNHQPLDGMIREFISSDYNTLVITGEAGAGKTLFTKLTALEQLYKFKQDGYLFIRVSLPQIEGPFEDLLEKALKTYGIDISKNPELTEELKNRKIVWFFDAYDEIAFKNEAEKKLPINRFGDWKNSKFIFTCKSSIYQQLEPQVFDPLEGGKKKVIYTASFNSKKIDKYLKNFVKVRRQNVARGDTSVKTRWDYTRYKQVITELSKIPNMSEHILSNPFYLKITSDVLPYIEEKERDKAKGKDNDLLVDITNLFLKSLPEIKTNLYDAFACVMAARSSSKTKLDPLKPKDVIFTAVEFLDYSVRVALAMKRAKIQWVTWGPQSANIAVDSKISAASAAALPLNVEEKRRKEPDIPALFDESDENIKNHFFKKECLVLRDGKWGFRHNDIHTYYRALGEALGGAAWNRVRRLILNDDFKFKKIFSHDV